MRVSLSLSLGQGLKMKNLISSPLPGDTAHWNFMMPTSFEIEYLRIYNRGNAWNRKDVTTFCITFSNQNQFIISGLNSQRLKFKKTTFPLCKKKKLNLRIYRMGPSLNPSKMLRVCISFWFPDGCWITSQNDTGESELNLDLTKKDAKVFLKKRLRGYKYPDFSFVIQFGTRLVGRITHNA